MDFRGLPGFGLCLKGVEVLFLRAMRYFSLPPTQPQNTYLLHAKIIFPKVAILMK
jgi:hypothetical protein